MLSQLTIKGELINADINNQHQGDIRIKLSADQMKETTAVLTILKPTLIDQIDVWNGDYLKATLNADHYIGLIDTL